MPLVRLCAALLCLALFITPAAHADDPTPEGDGRTTWGITPAAEDSDDDDAPPRISIRLGAEPGATEHDAVTVTNYGSRPATFNIYASDGVITADGQFDILPSTSDITGAGEWIRIGTPSGDLADPGEVVVIDIEPESDVTLPVEVTVPDNATPGDHPAGIVAALAGADGQVGVESRVGVRMHLRVDGEIQPELTVESLNVSHEQSWNPFTPGSARLDYVIANTGNVRLGAEVSAGGSSVFGLTSATSDDGEHREILPGQTAEGSILITDVWPLFRHAGELTVEPVVVGEDEIAATLVVVSQSWSAATIPWTIIVLVVIAGAGVWVMRWVARRRESRIEARIASAVEKATVA